MRHFVQGLRNHDYVATYVFQPNIKVVPRGRYGFN